MKLCEYCGRENQDEARACHECGSNQFKTAISVEANIANEVVETAPDAPVELQRCRDPEGLAEITQILEATGIPYKNSTLPVLFDLGKIGAGEDAQVIVSVSREFYDSARAALEAAYLKLDLPPNHYLLTSTDEELVEMVGQASEWSPFDVAHARRLIGERGIDSKKIEDKRAEHLRRLRQGRPASQWLLFFGWLFSMLGGWIGLGIAWSLSYMKEKTPYGEFFIYDRQSRAIGKKMLGVGLAVIASALILWFFLVLPRK